MYIYVLLDCVTDSVTLTLTKSPPQESNAANVEWNPSHADGSFLVQKEKQTQIAKC